MRVLYLGPRSPIYAFLCLRTEEHPNTERPVGRQWLLDLPTFDWIVAYRYKHKVPADALAMYPGRVVNVHPSFLPHNRGLYPNAWAWYDNTPHGVSVHLMDAGLDTGPLLRQSFIQGDNVLDPMGEAWTLRSTHRYLDGLCIATFIDWWNSRARSRRGCPWGGAPQPPGGSYHSAADFERVIRPLLTDGWDTPVQVLVEAGRRARGE